MSLKQLEAHLAAEAAQSESYFRAALAREDQLRIEKLRQLMNNADTSEQFLKEGLYIGWTAGDLRSKELAPAFLPFAQALWAAERDNQDVDLMTAWNLFNAQRMRILIHCLS